MRCTVPLRFYVHTVDISLGVFTDVWFATVSGKVYKPVMREDKQKKRLYQRFLSCRTTSGMPGNHNISC